MRIQPSVCFLFAHQLTIIFFYAPIVQTVITRVIWKYRFLYDWKKNLIFAFDSKCEN